MIIIPQWEDTSAENFPQMNHELDILMKDQISFPT